MRNMKGVTLLAVTLLLSLPMLGQETLLHNDPQEHYKRGLELYDYEQYLPAKKEFEAAMQATIDDPEDEELYLFQANIAYYTALSSMKAYQPDAEKLFLDFLEDYHETPNARKAYFHLGNYYFREKSYFNSAKYYQMVDILDLEENDDIIEYKFKLGYSYFVKKKFNAAKPLFRDIRDLQTKYYYPANYYYGFISLYTNDLNEALESFLRIEDTEMYKAVIPYYIAQIYFRKGEYNNVIDYLQGKIGNPQLKYQAEMAHLMGQSYFELGNYAQAVVYLQEYVNNTKKVRPSDLYQLGFAQYKTSDYLNAIDNFTELNVVDDSLGQNAMYILADIYVIQGNKEEARTAYGSAANMPYDDVIREASLLNYAKLSYELDFNKQAVDAIQTLLADYPYSDYRNEAYELLTDVLLASNDYQGALEILESTGLNSPKMKEAYQKVTYYSAVQMYNDQRLDDAMEAVNKSLGQPINNKYTAMAYYLRGEINYQQKQYDAAITQYNSYLSTGKNLNTEAEGVTAMRANYNIGFAYLKKEDYTTALNYFNKAASLYNSTNDEQKNAIYADASLRAADSYFMLKNYSGAINKYNQLITANNDWSDYAMLQKGLIQGLQGNTTGKITTLNQLAGTYPSSPYADDALYQVGVGNQELSKNMEAITAYNKLISEYPNSDYRSRAHLRLGLTHYNLGNTQSALDNYKYVVINYPNTAESKEALKVMEEIYQNLGRPDDYIAFVNSVPDLSISVSAQDSLYWETAYENYLLGDCDKAITGFSTYINKFRNAGGYFLTDAYFYRAECLFKAKNYVNALSDYDYVLGKRPNSHIKVAAAKAGWVAFYQSKDYNKSKNYYSILYEQTKYSTDHMEGLMGLLRSVEKLGQKTEIVQYANEVIGSGQADASQKTEARLFKGRALLANNQLDAALTEFETIAANSNSLMGAEAQYQVAYIYFKKGNYDRSLDECFELKDNFSSYEYWYVKAFILMADNYYADGNTYQAKATLESILSNYDGDQGLIDEAQRKLDFIIEQEKGNSRIQYNYWEGDSLIMDNQ